MEFGDEELGGHGEGWRRRGGFWAELVVGREEGLAGEGEGGPGGGALLGLDVGGVGEGEGGGGEGTAWAEAGEEGG